MSRRTAQLLMTCALATFVGLYAQHAYMSQAQTTGKPAATKPAQKPAAPQKTDAQKIAEAVRAAPAAITKNATIMDWSDPPKTLRAGTNGWVCYPNTPGEFGAASVEDPMCLDKQWQNWAQGFMTKKAPTVTGTGIAYMLMGDKGASNTDPFATGPTATNNWVTTPGHIMVLYADLKMLDAFPTDPKSGGPWVMWKGTPYAHLMVPVSATKGAMMGMGK